MKIMTILGTRPEIIRLSRIIPSLDKLSTHILVHTGQNFTRNLSDVFFQELKVRRPDYVLECKSGSAMQEIGKILAQTEHVILSERPDRVLILGDTNSALSSIVAKRNGVPVFHMEAGNRCYDDRVPEEVNRRIVDHASDVLMPYTERSRFNLLREGIPSNRIYVTGNPIKEVLDFYAPQIEKSRLMKKLGLRKSEFLLVTLHRAENVDAPERLKRFVNAFHRLQKRYEIPVILSLHPRTRSRLLGQSPILARRNVQAIEPPGFLDFVHLERNARCVLTDSGTVQEECCILRVPTVTLRDSTERPETVEAGSNVLSGSEPNLILQCTDIAMHELGQWSPPAEYLRGDVSKTVTKMLVGFHQEWLQA